MENGQVIHSWSMGVESQGYGGLGGGRDGEYGNTGQSQEEFDVGR